jgi:phospholipase D1/2
MNKPYGLMLQCFSAALILVGVPDVSLAEALHSFEHAVSMLNASNADSAMVKAFIYITALVGAALLCLPISPLVMMVIGASFSPFVAVAIACVGRSLGDGLSFLLFRYFLQARVALWLPERVRFLPHRISQEGVYALMLLRLLPIVPAGFTNALMAISSLPLGRFLAASTAGVLPWIVLFVWTGQRVGAITAPADILHPEFIMLIAGLVLLTLAARHYRRRWIG